MRPRDHPLFRSQAAVKIAGGGVIGKVGSADAQVGGEPDGGSDASNLSVPAALGFGEHKAPSGPVVIPCESLPGVGIGYSVMVPAVVIRPMLLPHTQ